MNDHNLDDLIIDNINPKNPKAKSLLTIIALAIVVLIVAIILTKVILKEPKDKLAINQENNSEMISPDLTLQNAVKKEIIQEKLSLETNNKRLDTDTDTDTIISSKTITTAKKETFTKSNAPKKTIKDKVVEKIKTEETKPKTVEITQDIFDDEIETSSNNEAEKLAQEKEATKKKKLAKQERAKQKAIAAKKLAKQKAAKETKRKEENRKKASTQNQGSGRYYIQVGSFRQSPSKQFLSIIKKSGFNYKITTPSSSGSKKLLIGPYASRASADNALSRVRDRINKSAFVTKR